MNSNSLPPNELLVNESDMNLPIQDERKEERIQLLEAKVSHSNGLFDSRKSSPNQSIGERQTKSY